MKEKAEHITTIDLKGMGCPHPTAIVLNKLRNMQTGDLIQVITDTAGAEESILKLCRGSGHQILKTKREAGLTTLLIRKQG